jgi:hypothetical protein
MGGTRSTSEEDVNSYKVSLSKTQTEQTNWPTIRYEDNIKMNLKWTGVNMGMKVPVP